MVTARILTVSHSAVVAGYHDRYREVARQAGLELTLLVPRRWRQFNRRVTLEHTSDPQYRIVACQPLAWGLRRHALRNVTHVYPGMKKLLKEVRPDIIELWEEPFAAVTAHAIWCARRVCPSARVIFFSAQNILKRYPPPFSWFERYTYRRADFAFVMNEEARTVIGRKGYRKPSLVLPLGVNPARFRKSDASELRRKLGLEGFIVGFVGKFERQKGVLDLLAAAARLKGNIGLLLIGSGSLEAEVRRRAGGPGGEGGAAVVGTVPYEELPEYLSAMDVLVMPSISLPGLREQFGRALIEAMACGVPVIGSSSGEIPRVIGEAGLIFPEGNVAALAGKIESLRNDPAAARRLAERGRERVEREFTWEVIARKQAEVYRRLMGWGQEVSLVNGLRLKESL